MRRPARACAAALAVGVALSCAAAPAGAQLSGVNLIEGQAGNIPFREPPNRTDFYAQLNLGWAFESGRVGVRLETDQNSDNTFVYRALTQRWFDWRDDRLRVRVGNFYTILGRGLVHRSFELPGVVLEQPGLRSRFGPSRDLDGGLIEAEAGPVALRLFSGQPNAGDLSPASDALGLPRYAGQVSGGQVAAALWRGARAGVAFVRSPDGVHADELGSGFVELDALRIVGLGGASVPLVFEYAQKNGSLADWWRFTGGDSAHALYARTGLLAGPIALSAEWKDYRRFRFGTNDPPSLVREHGWALLNRGTHVLDAERERGFQLEGSWTHGRWGSLTLNWSRSDGRPSRAPARFEERYAEIRIAPAGSNWDATLFVDSGRDEFVAVGQRDVLGLAGTLPIRSGWAVELDFQRLHASRGRFVVDRFDDHLASATVTRAGWGSLAVQWERSTDPEQEDPASFGVGSAEPRHFVAGILGARLSERHEATLLVGERRGGRACTAGTCYEVQPFKGAELRLLSRF